MLRRCAVMITLFLAVAGAALADGPADNSFTMVRQVPPPGIEIPEADREQLAAGLQELNQLVGQLKLRRDARTPQLLTDVEIFQRAIQQSLDFNELYTPNEIAQAHEVLAEGLQRAKQLLAGDSPWTEQTGLVVRGYRSKLDGTVQPYGLVIPEAYSATAPACRCDLWFHGRGERMLETQFIAQRMRNAGQIQPAETIVLHPFGRYSNAFKFAGEVDVWEALEHAKANYHLDDRRVAVRGFSMGGAGAWHFAVHYPRQFFVATPGAGFSETPEFLKSFQGETLNPPVFEERLWQLYDCPPWVENLRLIPTIAYSGEIDKQKQAADVMEAACKAQGMELVHLIGPQTAHSIHADSAIEIERRIQEVIDNPPAAPSPFTAVTCTLKYNDFGQIQLNGLQEHWVMSRATVDMSTGQCEVTSEGVTDLTIHLPQEPYIESITVNGQSLIVRPEQSDAGQSIRLYLEGETWAVGTPAAEPMRRKEHGLQGPIDDAFMDSFLFVTPSEAARHPAIETWVEGELQHAHAHWRQHMRGDARLKSDSEVTDEDIANHNLILWGDPASNAFLAKILPQLPLTWTEQEVKIGTQVFPADSHVPVLIYPNPLNPKRYIVLNSGFTFREYDYLNNARQTPKLPDWALIDVRVPSNPRWPGDVVAADFFNERWEVKP